MSKKSDVKIYLKQVLVKQLDEKPFSKLTVMDLCRETGISRVTFYTWYDDKYDLLEDYFNDMLNYATDTYKRLQKENNPNSEAFQGYLNLFDAVLQLYYNHYDFFKHTSQGDDEELYLQFSSRLLRNVENYMNENINVMRPKYSTRETTSFICAGLWAFVHTCKAENRPVEEIRENTESILVTILNSELFTH